MKKYLILTIVAAMIALVIIFPTQPIEEDFEVPVANLDADGNITYVFPEDVCEVFFGTNVIDTVESLKNIEWLPSKSVFENEKGELVVCLSEDDYIKWVIFDKRLVESTLDDAKHLQGFEITISDDYKDLSIKANKETGYGTRIGGILMKIVPSLCMLQVYNGTNPSDMRLKMHFSNIDTGNIVWQGVFPGDTVSLSEEDWDV